jgi:hypothetical protein
MPDIDPDLLARQMARLLTEMQGMREEIGSLYAELNSMRDEIRALSTTVLRMDGSVQSMTQELGAISGWLAEQSPRRHRLPPARKAHRIEDRLRPRVPNSCRNGVSCCRFRTARTKKASERNAMDAHPLEKKREAGCMYRWPLRGGGLSRNLGGYPPGRGEVSTRPPRQVKSSTRGRLGVPAGAKADARGGQLPCPLGEVFVDTHLCV